MKKVSLIVPVYNSEKYIGKCLDSILNQTYTNLEILVINDGSKDNSQEVINNYKEKYPDKIVAIEQSNKGVAITRNESIKRANGDYIMFVDNDDFLDKDYIEIFVKAIEDGEYDVVLGGYRRPNEAGKIIKTLSLQDEEWSKFMIMAPWAKIYKKQYLIDNNIEFLSVNLGEDIYFNLKAMLVSKKIKIIPYTGYNWFFNTSSVSNTTQKNITQLQVYELLDSCYEMVSKEGLLEENYEIIKTHFTRYIVWLISFSTKKLSYKVISEEYDKIFKWLEEKFPDYKTNKMISYKKPVGELFTIRFLTKTFLIAHNLHLGKLLTYIYSKI
ncbi:MAG: glycosyltransferase [Clostridia bacterium]|nr:glycosyltransferase [Clostridia bacterium]